MSAPSGVVTLLTDFGLVEPFVGVMKGVILSRAPKAITVDLTHDVPAHDVAFAAFWLGNAAPWFPPGTVHLCVVDPGVGTGRRAIVAECAEQWFVAPDNGVLSAALQSGQARVYQASVPPGVSRTFHGRDVFAPLAADLAAGKLRPEETGAPIDDWVRLALPVAEQSAGTIRGTVVAVDHFGNLLTNIRLHPGDVGRVRAGQIGVDGARTPGVELRIVESYADAGNGAALVNAWGLLELAVCSGRASEVFGFGVGAWVALELDGGARDTPLRP